MERSGKLHINTSIRLFLTIALGISFLFFSSCRSTRRVQEGEYLVKKNRVIVEEGKFSSEDLKELIRQRPNRKTLLVFNMHLWFYNMGMGKNQDGKTKTWLRKIGEAPVIYDSTETVKSSNRIQQYLFQNGYYNAVVTDSLIYNNKQRNPIFLRFLNPFRNRKKVILKYTATLGEPYIVSQLNYDFSDPNIEGAFAYLNRNELPKIANEIYNYKKLDEHRNKIATHFQNMGYYDFKKDYIKYRIDTNLGNHKVHVTARFLNPVKTDSRGNSTTLQHTSYKIDNIYVYPEYKLFETNRFTDTLASNGVFLVYNPPLKINPKLLPSKIFLGHDNYKIDNVRSTYQNLNGMALYRSINLDFQYQSPQENLAVEKLNAFVYLSPLKRHNFTIETRAETRAYTGRSSDEQNITNFNFGVSGNVSFSRINAFKNGETLKLSFTAGLEPFFLSDTSSANNFFNTIEFGPSIQLTFPRFLLPISQSKFSKSNRPQTTISATYNLLQNTDFLRRATKIGLSYSWLESTEKLHKITPVDITFVNAKLNQALQNRLDALNNPFLNNTYSDQVILASSYTFTYRKTEAQAQTNGWYNRFKIEGAGNFARSIASLANPSHTPSTTYQLLNITFAQYLGLENDLRYYRYNRLDQTLALRLFTGIAKPLDNLNALPFEKSYFAGGSNGIRAWRARSLGPGSFLDTTSFSGFLNRIGEIRIETSAEYRFNIISFIEGALFVDAGNVWVFDEKSGRAGTEFDRSFGRDFAIGAGFGMRLDFDFFIIRFDLGFPLRDPSLPDGEKWFFQDKDQYNALVYRYNERNSLAESARIPFYKESPNFNIGIGYPF